MGQSCLLSFLGVMWIILYHFCMSPNTKISAAISCTLKNRIIYLFQQVLKLNISQDCKMIPIMRRIHHRTKNHLGNACIFFPSFFFPLTDFFFFWQFMLSFTLKKNPCVMSHSSILTISFVWEWFFFLLLFSFIPLMNNREDSQNDDYFHPVFTINLRMKI